MLGELIGALVDLFALVWEVLGPHGPDYHHKK